ncbi:hypothetical protein M427DRAFT_156242 [Gonapodya prolifera JEL478]|uniref:Chromo domain-containing protein n=1 Tax=Gonapodya prolifera (strain JEL478) TaxID=1344416 RepID=A0A139ABA3_GONPJ|nr:hypothetical protein M427DRAFT_156242 [Gonapodya prolifera JEL478]|eukprot:KXS14017.1 hypothetical protein M427DRAFT_156242 [Gonapodya prolifera JEL478]
MRTTMRGTIAWKELWNEACCIDCIIHSAPVEALYTYGVPPGDDTLEGDSVRPSERTVRGYVEDEKTRLELEYYIKYEEWSHRHDAWAR